MELILLRYLLFVPVLIDSVIAACDRNTGPAGSNECVLLQPHYNKHQWATCLTNTYIQTYSKGEHICRDNFSQYCWYQCMIELHDLEKGPVYDDCACGPDAPTGRTTQPTVVTSAIPTWCFSPSGAECTWYRSCLEKRYPCKESGNSYALDYAEKFCNLYQQHYSKFDNTGQRWIDGVRKCLQVNLAPILRPFIRKTCEQIKQMAFDSHPGCYVKPDDGAPSVCDIGVRNWARVFWTVKSAVIQATTETFKQMIEVIQACGGELLTDGMQLIKLKIKQTKDAIQESLDQLSETISDTLSENMGWIKKGIMHFGYPVLNHILKKRSTNNANDENAVYINILLAERSRFDLNDENSPVANVSGAAIDVAKAIAKGDVRLDVADGMEFTELSVCASYNCSETILQVTSPPPKEDKGGINVTTVIIIICVGTFAVVLVSLSVIVLRKMRKC